MQSLGQFIGQLSQNVTVATFRRTPTSQHLPLQLSQSSLQLLVFQQVFPELLDTAVPSVLVHFEGISPYAASSSSHVVVMPAYIDMGGVFQPLHQVFKANFSEIFYFNVDDSRLLALLYILDLHWLLLRHFLFGLVQGYFLLLLRFKKSFLDVFDLLLALHYKSFINPSRVKLYGSSVATNLPFLL